MRNVTIYSKAGCAFCTYARQLLTGRNVGFVELDVANDPALLHEMISRSGGRYTGPQIFIGDYHVGGYTDPAPVGSRAGCWLPRRSLRTPGTGSRSALI
jgi:glutaredoxin 3